MYAEQMERLRLEGYQRPIHDTERGSAHAHRRSTWLKKDSITEICVATHTRGGAMNEFMKDQEWKQRQLEVLGRMS